jgi:hypothetical protein
VYDSRDDTIRHIGRVGELLGKIAWELSERARLHDASKLLEPEKSVFDAVTPALKGLTYGSAEYKAQLAAMGPALEHHYRENRHHPEHWQDGINGMSLVDLVEMFCDWKAATERHADGSLERSIQHNKTRFVMTDQLAAVFENTRRELNW